jgi:hypothetical protein
MAPMFSRNLSASYEDVVPAIFEASAGGGFADFITRKKVIRKPDKNEYGKEVRLLADSFKNRARHIFNEYHEIVEQNSRRLNNELISAFQNLFQVDDCRADDPHKLNQYFEYKLEEWKQNLKIYENTLEEIVTKRTKKEFYSVEKLIADQFDSIQNLKSELEKIHKKHRHEMHDQLRTFIESLIKYLSQPQGEHMPLPSIDQLESAGLDHDICSQIASLIDDVVSEEDIVITLIYVLMNEHAELFKSKQVKRIIQKRYKNISPNKNYEVQLSRIMNISL